MSVSEMKTNSASKFHREGVNCSRRHCSTNTNMKDEGFLPPEMKFDNQGNHRWEDAPARFLWT